MASPQVEDGFTRIANELLEALAQSEISSTKHRAILMIVRETYGYQRTAVTVGYHALAVKYKIDKAQLIRAMTWLVKHQYLTCERGETITSPNTWAVQKDYSRWGHKLTSSNSASSATDTSAVGSLVSVQTPVTSVCTDTTPLQPPLMEERNLKKNDDVGAPDAAAVEAILRALGQTAKQRREILAKRTTEDGRLTLTAAEAESWRPFLARPPGWCERPEAYICSSLKAGDPVPTERVNGYQNGRYGRAGPVLGDAPDYTEQEAQQRGAATKQRIHDEYGIPPNA